MGRIEHGGVSERAHWLVLSHDICRNRRDIMTKLETLCSTHHRHIIKSLVRIIWEHLRLLLKLTTIRNSKAGCALICKLLTGLIHFHKRGIWSLRSSQWLIKLQFFIMLKGVSLTNNIGMMGFQLALLLIALGWFLQTIAIDFNCTNLKN